MDEVNQRVMKVIGHYGMSKSSFAQSIEVSPPVITHISSGRNKVGLDVVQKILHNYPELSPEWLILGVGDMIHQDKLKARAQVKQDLDALESRLKTISQEVSVALNALDKAKDRL